MKPGCEAAQLPDDFMLYRLVKRIGGLGDLTKNILNWGHSWFPSLEMLIELATEKLTEEKQ